VDRDQPSVDEGLSHGPFRLRHQGGLAVPNVHDAEEFFGLVGQARYLLPGAVIADEQPVGDSVCERRGPDGRGGVRLAYQEVSPSRRNLPSFSCQSSAGIAIMGTRRFCFGAQGEPRAYLIPSSS
jgi:hypothetical protein